MGTPPALLLASGAFISTVYRSDYYRQAGSNTSDAVLAQLRGLSIALLVRGIYLGKVGAAVAEPVIAHFLQLREVFRGCEQFSCILLRPQVQAKEVADFVSDAFYRTALLQTYGVLTERADLLLELMEALLDGFEAAVDVYFLVHSLGDRSTHQLQLVT